MNTQTLVALGVLHAALDGERILGDDAEAVRWIMAEHKAQAALLAECAAALEAVCKEARLAVMEPLAHNEIGFAVGRAEALLVREAQP